MKGKRDGKALTSSRDTEGAVWVNTLATLRVACAGRRASVQADIVTDRRTIIDFLLSPVTQYVAEGVRVR